MKTAQCWGYGEISGPGSPHLPGAQLRYLEWTRTHTDLRVLILIIMCWLRRSGTPSPPVESICTLWDREGVCIITQAASSICWGKRRKKKKASEWDSWALVEWDIFMEFLLVQLEGPAIQRRRSASSICNQRWKTRPAIERIKLLMQSMLQCEPEGGHIVRLAFHKRLMWEQ